MGKQWKQCQTLFFWAPKSLQMVTAAMKLKDAKKVYEDSFLAYKALGIQMYKYILSCTVTKTEHSAWMLGIQARSSAQTSLHEFSQTLAPCSGR